MKNNQAIQVYKHLVKHGSITPLEALNTYGIMRLGARIWELRKYRTINMELVKSGKKRYAKYSLA